MIGWNSTPLSILKVTLGCWSKLAAVYHSLVWIKTSLLVRQWQYWHIFILVINLNPEIWSATIFFWRPVPPSYSDVGHLLLHLVARRGPGPLCGEGGQRPQLLRPDEHDEEPSGHCEVPPREASHGPSLSWVEGTQLPDGYGSVQGRSAYSLGLRHLQLPHPSEKIDSAVVSDHCRGVRQGDGGTILWGATGGGYQPTWAKEVNHYSWLGWIKIRIEIFKHAKVVTDASAKHVHAPSERDLLHGGEWVQPSWGSRHTSGCSRKGFSLLWNFFWSLWRFPRPWGTSCTCRPPWRRPPGAMSLAMWFTSISILSWYHKDESEWWWKPEWNQPRRWITPLLNDT